MILAEAAAHAFIAEGVKDMFGLLGDGCMEFVAASNAGGVGTHEVRHEGMGLAMADGYARVSGHVGVCYVTRGPGVTQLATSLSVAAHHRTPIVIYAADTPAGEWGTGLQFMDQEPFIRATGAMVVPLRGPKFVAEDVQRAFAWAERHSLPVVLNAPGDVQKLLVPEPFVPKPSTGMRRATPPPLPAPEAVAEAAALLASARAPIFIAGRGAVAAEAIDCMRALASEVGALLGTTLPAMSAFGNDPWSIGIVGGYSNALAEQLLSEADLLVVVGASLAQRTTKSGSLFRRAKVVVVNRDAAIPVSPERPPDVVIEADACLGIKALHTAFTTLGAADGRYRTERVAAALADDPRLRDLREAPFPLAPGSVDPREAVMDFDRALPDNCVVVVGTGHFASFPPMFLRPCNRTFLFAHDFGCVGQGLAMGIGAHVASRDVPVVVFEGDGGVLMNVQELDTAVRLGTNLLLVVMNDQGLGAEYHKLRSLSRPMELAYLPNNGLDRIARGFGAEGATYECVGSAAEVVRSFSKSGGVHVVDVPTARTVMSRPYRARQGLLG